MHMRAAVCLLTNFSPFSLKKAHNCRYKGEHCADLNYALMSAVTIFASVSAIVLFGVLYAFLMPFIGNLRMMCEAKRSESKK